jgi:predicted Zn-dependent protease
MAFYQIGDANIRQAKWDEAVRALQRSLWLNPYFSGPYILLGRAYLKLAQPAAAESMLRRGIDYDPNNRTAHYLLAQVLQQLGRSDEAAREFARAEQLQQQAGRPE